MTRAQLATTRFFIRKSIFPHFWSVASSLLAKSSNISKILDPLPYLMLLNITFQTKSFLFNFYSHVNILENNKNWRNFEARGNV